MMSENRVVGPVVAAVIAAGAGFFIARMTAPPPAAPPPAAEAAAPDTVKVKEAFLGVMDIGVEVVGAGNLSSDILAPAIIAAAPTGEAILAARVSGTVSEVTKRLGEAVKPGDVLARVDSAEGAAAAAGRIAAVAKLAAVRASVAREKSLFDQGVTSREAYEAAQAELAAAEAEARRATAAAAALHASPDGKGAEILSPIEGRVTVATARLGASVQADTELFRVADPRLVQINAAITAQDVQRIAPGDAALVMPASGGSFEGKVAGVTPTLSGETRAATAVIELTNAVSSITPGEGAQVRIMPKGSAPVGVVLPAEAVQAINGRDSVFVRTPEGFKVRAVVVGGRSAGRVEVLSGLKSGEQIATRNAFLLKAELGKGAEEE